jgi:DNA-directed RNA polymerase specialized sigma24 family protein
MSSDEGGSVTRWVGAVQGGDPDAVRALWERYFAQLVNLARRRLAAGRHAGAVEDEEDAALSAFESFRVGAARGKFPRLGGRDDLWRLLVVITSRKVGAQLDRRRAFKRGGHMSKREPADDAAWDNELAFAISRDPSPEFAAEMAEETRRLLDLLGGDPLRSIALWRMEGYTAQEIATRLGCTRRTVVRKLEMIRDAWRGAGE